MVVSDTAPDYEPLPTGLHQAVLVNIFDIGYQPNFNGRPTRKCVFLWELGARKKNGSRFTVTKKYTASLNEKALLRKDLESWRGKAFTADQLKGFELEVLIGKNCMLNLVAKVTRQGKNFVDVSSVLNIQKGLNPLIPETDKTYIPEWIQKAIDDQDVTQMGPDENPAQGNSNDTFDDDIPF